MSAFENIFDKFVLNVQNMFPFQKLVTNILKGFDKRFMSAENDVVSNFGLVFCEMYGVL